MKTIFGKIATVMCAALILGACSNDGNSESRDALQALIVQAETLMAESIEGTEEGDIAPGSKKLLQNRIDQVYHIMNNTSWNEGYENAYTILEAAMQAFSESIIKAGIPYFNAGAKMNLGPVGDWNVTGQFTWEMKIRFDEFVAGDQNVISCEQSPGGIMIRNNGANLQFYINDGGWKGGTCLTMELNTWYHIAATYKANEKLQFYVNGVQVKEFACGTVLIAPTCNLQLGVAPSYSNRYMRGNIQHVSLWSDIRTAEEVAADVACNFNGTEDGLQAYWPLTLNLGTEITDVTGNHVAVFTDVPWNDPE
jgi:hypothetical protein